MLLLIISHTSVKFYNHRSRESELLTFFICHVTLYDHVINRLCDMWLCVLWKLRYNIFHLLRDNLITWSTRQKTQWIVVVYYKPPPCQIWQLEVEIYRFLFATRLYVTTWSQGHVALMIVVSQLNSPVCQVLWPSLVKVEIWSISVFNVSRRIHMIISLQVLQFNLADFWQIPYYRGSPSLPLNQAITNKVYLFPCHQAI